MPANVLMKLEADDWMNVGRLVAFLGAWLFCTVSVYFADVVVRLLEIELREYWTCSAAGGASTLVVLSVVQS